MRLGTIHHSIALFPFHKAGIQHINHQVGGTDDIQRSFNFVSDNQVNVTFGPGQHPTSSAEFLYFTGPDGMTFEYSTGVCEIHDEPLWRDRQFHFEPKGFCKWGAAPRIAAFGDAKTEGR
jgi:2,3-dihydroxy-p-cumate/2,3-dihydroxybenzoate 3,4-dioxygenase